MKYIAQREEIIDTCRYLERIGYFLGTWGNVSSRVPEGILLTPSKVEYCKMLLNDIVLIDAEGNVLESTCPPTSEKEIHRRILNAREDINAIVHVHTANAMAVSAADTDRVPCMSEEMSQLLGGEIPLTERYVPAEQHAILGEVAAEAIGKGNGLILRNHGAVACGRTMAEAVLSAKVIEKACEMYLSLMNRTDIKEIPEQYVQSERYRYCFKYGHEQT